MLEEEEQQPGRLESIALEESSPNIEEPIKHNKKSFCQKFFAWCYIFNNN